jgi:UDP-N-acetylglucosamine 1-carboxyvinyltransferase
MECLEITGGKPLQGTLVAGGNKNAVLPMIAACLLTEEPMTLTNVPGIRDVETMLGLVRELGGVAERDPVARTLTISSRGLAGGELSRAGCTALRTSILFAAPLIHRLGKAVIWPPGGDVIGRRRLDVHFHGLETLGTRISSDDRYRFEAPRRLRGADLFLMEASVTGTEQILMAAVLAEGTTVIRNAASEPHVQDLAKMLNQMGARISGLGTNTFIVEGVERLHGATHPVCADFAEVGSYLAMAAMTRGDVTVTGIDPDDYRMIAAVFAKLGVILEFSADSVRVVPGQTLRVQRELGGGMTTIDDGPWPHFPTDLMSIMIVLATQTEGTVLFFEKMFESRMYFVDRLIGMGANAVICDPHRAVISGPSCLHGIDLSTPDIRAGIAMVGAALCAKGKSRIHNVHLIDRGYEQIDERLRSLGCDVRRLTV